MEKYEAWAAVGMTATIALAFTAVIFGIVSCAKSENQFQAEYRLRQTGNEASLISRGFIPMEKNSGGVKVLEWVPAPDNSALFGDQPLPEQ